MSAPAELTCRELVELVTEFLDGALPDAELSRFEEHLVYCAPCGTHVEQMRGTIATTGQLRDEDVPADVANTLLTAFRDWRSGRTT